jgi:antitoxin PrlF
MAIATLTTTGQLTVPKKIRDSLKLQSGDKIEIVLAKGHEAILRPLSKRVELQSGDKIEIVLAKGHEAILRPLSKRVDETFCMLHRPGQKAVSPQEIDDAVKKAMKESSG